MNWNIFKRNNTQVSIGPVEDIADYNPTTAIFGNFNTDYKATGLSAFFAAVNLISNSIAMLPIRIKQGNTILPTNKSEIFERGLMSKFMFMKMLIWDLLIHGESLAYIERDINGNPIELVYCEKGSFSVQYVQNKRSLYYLIPFLRQGQISPNDVIHLYALSDNGINGKAISNYAFQILKLAKSTDKAAQRYYSSGCAVQGALSIKGSRKGAKEAARAAFQRTHAGDNASGLVILDDDMTYMPLGSNANDSQMLESRLFNVSEIARLFNLNPVLLGDLSKSSYSTIEQAQIEFTMHCLMPYITMIECEMSRKLFSNGYKVDLDESYLLRGDKSTMANYIKSLTESGILSINEGREILGYEPIEDGDAHRISYSDPNQNKIEGSEDKKNNNDTEE